MRSAKITLFFASLALCSQAPSAQAADPAVEALALYRAGKCNQAEPMLRQILEKQPKNTSVRKLLAGCLVQLHRNDEARSEYQQVLKTSPGDPEAVRALQPPPPPEVAVKQPQPRQPSERERAGAPLDEAERLIAAAKLDEGERILVALVKRAPDLAVPAQRLAEIYTRRKEYGKAANEYATLAERHPNTPLFRLRAAQNATWNKDYDQAAVHYRQYLLQNSGDAAAQLELAGVLLWSNHMEESAVAYKLYLGHNPDDVDARLNFADALLWSKQFDEASAEFRHVLEKRPTDSEAYYGLGQCYEEASKLDLALKAYQKAAELNPTDQKAAEAHTRVAEILPQHRGYERLEKKEYVSAATSFVDYLKEHPDSTETMLEVARVYSWGKLFSEAAGYYRQYLERVPNDDTARRELAKIDLTLPDFSRAQEDYLKLASGGHATADDYEGLVNAFVWDNKVEEAQPYAERLAAMSPGNTVALETHKIYREQERLKLFENAQALTAASRTQEALALYHAYAARFGSDKEIDLAVCRAYNWAKQYPTAVMAYLEYLRRYGNDDKVRVELANVQMWSGDPRSAERTFHDVLDHDRTNPSALLGLAQISDQRGDDRFDVVNAYKKALVQDATVPAARERVEQLGPAVSPSIAYRQTSFSDSDSFARSINRFEGGFPMRGGLKLVPMFGYDYFSQNLQVGGTACGAKEANATLKTLDNQICAKNGTVRAPGAGGRFELSPSSHFSLTGEVYQPKFDTNRSASQYRADAVFQGAGHALILSVMQRDAVYDVNTIASLFDGVRGRHAFVSYQQPLNERWRMWLLGGVSDYSRSNSGASPQITQRRFGARLDYQVSDDFTVSYYARGTTFNKATPLFFSPSYYGVYGFAYALRKPVSTALHMRLDGELGYGQIDRFNNPRLSTLEVMLFPGFEWKMRSDLNLLFGYRYGRGRSSAFGAPAYSSNSIDIRLEGSFMPSLSRDNPSRLDIH